MVDFGDRLKKLRYGKNLTQEQLANQVGVTKSVISAYETSIRMPSYEVLIKLSSVFYVTTDYLLGNEKAENFGFRNLTEKQKQAVLTLIDAFRDNEE